MKEVIGILKDVLERAEDHPMYLGNRDDFTEEEINDIGGDAAFITADIAWCIQDAIKLLEKDNGI